MFRFVSYALMRVVRAVSFCVMLATMVHAEPAALWQYKGSTVELVQSGADVTIRFSTLSDLLSNSGAQVGDILFRGQRFNDRLSGTAFKFYGPRCGALGFTVQGEIAAGKIVLQGIAPGLGLNSCRVETTFYDTLLLAAGPAQQREPQVAFTPAREPVDMRPPAASYASVTSTSPPVYLLFRFRCVIENGQPVFEKTNELYYHEALDYQPPVQHQFCPPDRGDGLTVCRALDITSMRLVCKDGIASAPQLTLAHRSKGVRVQGDTVLVQIYTGPGASQGPENYHRFPAGFGILPDPKKIMSAADFVQLYDPAPSPVPVPKSFFLSLIAWQPWPQAILIPLFSLAILFAGFGFYIDQDSSLSPRRPLFWIGLSSLRSVLSMPSELEAISMMPTASDDRRLRAPS